MYYETYGEYSNFAIVFLHGWGGSVNSFRPVINLLPHNRHYIINLDFAGFGNSPQPSFPYRVEDYAKEVIDLLYGLNINKVIFVCHSFGGRVVLEIARLYPKILAKIVFVDSAGLKRKKSLKQKYLIFKYKIIKRLCSWGLINKSKLKKYGSEEYKVLSDIMKKTFVLVVNENLEDRLSLINVPTLVVWGEKDKDTPLYMAKRFKHKIKNAKLIVYKESGHFSYLDNLEDFVYSLCMFIENEV